ncbi:MAG: sulfite exporter TauE/SafE family protein [Candidatus Paceibacteria bacterium]
MSVQVQKWISIAVIIALFWGILLTLQDGGLTYWLHFWWMAFVAFAIAIVVNTIGISGAALFVPFFILVFPLLSEPLTSLQSVQVGLVTESFGLLSSAVAFILYRLVDVPIAVRTIATAIPSLVVGAFVTSLIPESVLLIMIAGLLLISVIFLLAGEYVMKRRHQEQQGVAVDLRYPKGTQVTRTDKDGKTYHYCRTMGGYLKRLTGYSVGAFFQGAVGFGIGELGIISMMLSRIPLRVAIGTSHLIVAVTAVLASAIHLGLFLIGHGVESEASGSFPWNLVFMTVPAVILGGQVSPYVASKLPTKALEYVIAIIFLMIAAALVVLAAQSL